jgi:hypothetical protein
MAFTIMALIILGVYGLIPDPITSDSTAYSATKIRQIPQWVELTALLSGMAVLAVLAFHNSFLSTRYFGEILVCLFACIQIMTILPHGTWVEKKKPTPSLAQMLAAKKIKLDYLSLPGDGLLSTVVKRHAQRSFLEPFIGKVYSKYQVAEDNKEAYNLMQQGRTADQVVVEEYKAAPESFDKKPQRVFIPGRVELTYSSFNRLVFNVQASGSSFFGMAYPNTGHWRASVNESAVRIYRANGAVHAVQVPAGQSRVEFRYRSRAAVWGMILSCVAFVSIGIFIGLFVLKRPIGLWIAIIAMFIGVGGFSIWYQSLYAGENFGTRYVWQESPSKSLLNLAYGRPTTMSSSLHANHRYLVMSNRAVDGDRTAGSSFYTNFQSNPQWLVDLRDTKSIGAVYIYESHFNSKWNKRPLLVAIPSNSKWNKRPLLVAISSNGKEYRIVKIVRNVNYETPIKVHFKEPQTGRYVLIQASGSCYLAFDEVEIYPPKK